MDISESIDSLIIDIESSVSNQETLSAAKEIKKPVIEENYNQYFDTQSIDSLIVEIESSALVEENITKPIEPKKVVKHHHFDEYFDSLILNFDEYTQGNKEDIELLDVVQEIIEEPLVVEEPVVVEEIKEDVFVEPEPKISEPFDAMSDLSNRLSKFLKRTNSVYKEPEPVDLQSVVENLNRQIQDVRRLVLENTIVSGIGAHGDGGSPGSGEVRINNMDDVNTDNLQDGDSLIWDNEQGKWVPGSSGGGGNGGGGGGIIGPITTRDVLLVNNMNVLEKLQRINPDLSVMSTQEDVNLALIDILIELDTKKPTISVGPNPHDIINTDRDIGDLWIDQIDNIMYYWDGTSWNPLDAACCIDQICENLDGGISNTDFTALDELDGNISNGEDATDGGNAIRNGCEDDSETNIGD